MLLQLLQVRELVIRDWWEKPVVVARSIEAIYASHSYHNKPLYIKLRDACRKHTGYDVLRSLQDEGRLGDTLDIFEMVEKELRHVGAVDSST